MAKRKAAARKFGRDVSVIVIAGIISGALALALYSRRTRAAQGDDDDLLTPEEIRDELIGVVSFENTRAALMAAEPTPHYFYPPGGSAEINPEWSDWFESLGPLSDEEFREVWGYTREEYTSYLV